MLDLEKSSVIPSPVYHSQGTGLKVTSPSSLSLPAAAHMQKDEVFASPAPSGIGFGQFFNNDKKSAKRTAGRIMKLHADIYSLMGRLDLAITR